MSLYQLLRQARALTVGLLWTCYDYIPDSTRTFRGQVPRVHTRRLEQTHNSVIADNSLVEDL